MSSMKVTMMVAMVALLVMTVTQPTGAVDIQGFDDASACTGGGYTFAGIAQQVCTQFATTVGSVLIRDLSSCQTGTAYSGGGCTTAAISNNGPDVLCFIGGGFTGAAWFNNCRRRRLQATMGESCTSNVSTPTGVHFTDSQGSWVLHTPNATQMMELLRALADAEKAEWLQAQGAHFISA